MYWYEVGAWAISSKLDARVLQCFECKHEDPTKNQNKKNSIQNLSEMLIESHIFYLLLVKSSVVQVAKMKGKETQDTLSFNILALKYNWH